MALAAGRRATAVAAFALLALVAELVGRSATMRLDRSLPVDPLATPTTPYYPFLLAGVKAVAAVAAAVLALRIVRAHSTAAAAERLLATVAQRRPTRPRRIRLRVSPRLWLASFAATSVWFLLQNDGTRLYHCGWPSLAPWLHTYALPVFAVLSILVAIGWAAVRDWLADVEGYAAAIIAEARCMLRPLVPAPRARPADDRAPRHLFGLAFESRPPPLPA
jgi:hypothetical protein